MTVNYCLRRASRLYANCIALDLHHRQITYSEFYQTVENTARKLATLGATKGDRVAVLMQNSPEYLDLYYSVAMTGAIIVPLNTRWHINEIVFTLNDSGSKMLFVDERFAPLVPQIRSAVPNLEHHIFVDDAEWKSFAADPQVALANYPEPDENDVVGLFYTSGTTGGPKGAMLTHRNLYTNAIHTLVRPLGLVKGWKWLHS